ncbi:MAG: GNAT family N-acetyltransferase [Pseudomonadota bacterium]|nr:GNAT family N-acetyltransferase [Pseudomonadota bacterium]
MPDGRLRHGFPAATSADLQEVSLPIIRKADRSDAGQLARLAETTFRDTFGALNTGEDMDRHCQASYSEAIQAAEISDPDRVTLLSVEGERLVGFVQLRWDGAPHCVRAESPGEIQRLYVVHDWHGKGIAHDLMDACIEAMEAHGSDVVWLGVWERNPRAISFYKKSGFVEVGDHVFPLGSDPQRDIVMARSVAGRKTKQP